MMIPDPPPVRRAAYRRVIHEILNGDFVPPGLRLRYKGRDRGDLTLTIVPIEEEPRPEIPPAPIPVPETLRGCHAIIKETREVAGKGKTGWVDTYHLKGVAHLRVHGSNLQRALLALQAMISEAECRGLTVTTGSSCDGLVVMDGPCSYELVIKEETRRLPHEPTASEVKQIERGYGWGVAKWDFEPTGRLVLMQGHGSYSMTTLAADRQRWTLEDKLGNAFEKFAAQTEAARLQALERERQQALRQQAWEEAMTAARLRYVDQKRTEWMGDQLARWRNARDLREFVTAARHLKELDEAYRSWLDWVAERADDLDPSNHRLRPTEPPEPTPEDLKPFVNGFSPYGPSRW